MVNKDTRPERTVLLPTSGQALRRRAEEIVRGIAAQSPEAGEMMSAQESRQTLHELRVHQIELEMHKVELRRTQAELVAERRRYFDLYDLAPVGYCSVSEGGLILEVNFTAASLLAVAWGALVKQQFSLFIQKEDQDFYCLVRKNVFATGMSQRCELRMVKGDGTSFLAYLETTITQDESGVSVSRVILSDAPERRGSEKRLLVRDSYLQALMQAIPDMVWLKDLDGVHLDCNAKFACFCGKAKKDIIGKTDYDLLEKGLADSFYEQDRQVIVSAQANTKNEWLTFAGTGYHGLFATDKTPLVDAGGRVIGLLAIGRDITERERASELSSDSLD